jgi:aryl-alcohol dehydrogenase-like predicted oxidoreductase
VLMRNLGRTGLKVAALCLGGNTFGWTTDQKASEAVLDAYCEGGGNFVDTADVYARWVPGNTGGESETVLGRWLQARGSRHRVIVATKVCGPMGPGPNDKGLSRLHILDGVDASLRRLQTDYVDLYQAHWDDREAPLEETLHAFDDLVRQGKVRYVGASNYTAWRLTRALWVSDRHGYARYESSRSTTSSRGTSTSAISNRSVSSRASASSVTRRWRAVSCRASTGSAAICRRRPARLACRRPT